MAGALWLCGTAGASAPRLRVAADARLELLGLVQLLSGLRRGPLPPGFEGLGERYASLSGHPAVRRYAEVRRGRPSGEDPFFFVMLFATEPPALAWGPLRRHLSSLQLERVGGPEAARAFLSELAAFAEAARFEALLAEKAPVYRLAERSARAEVGGDDPVGLAEAYLGEDLRASLTLIPALLYEPGDYTAYIIPYPYQGPGRMHPGPREVFSLAPPRGWRRGVPSFALREGRLFNELVYVVVERESERRAKRLAELSGLHRRLEGCFGDWRTCAQHHLVAAISRRLEARTWGVARDQPGQGCAGGVERALERRLLERERGPAGRPLAASFPALLDAFAEAEDSGRPCLEAGARAAR